MCLCGVWLRPNQSTMDRSSAAFASLKTPCYRTTIILSRGRKSGHNQWQMDHQKAMDARRGATKRHEYTSFLDRWQKDEIYQASQLAHGWTETYVKYLDYISEIDISCNAPYRQQVRYNNTVYMRGVDSNRQARPLCQRPDYESSADALVSLQRAQGKGVPHIPTHLKTRQNNTLDPAVQQHLERLSFNWKTYFSSSSSSMWTESPTRWSSPPWDHQWQERRSQGWQGKEWLVKSKNDNDRSGNCWRAKRYRLLSKSTAMNATESVQTTPHRTHTRALFLAAHATCDYTFGSRLDDSLCV